MNGRCAPDCGRRRNGTVAPGADFWVDASTGSLRRTSSFGYLAGETGVTLQNIQRAAMRATILGQPDFPIYLLARQPNAMPAEQTPNRYIPENTDSVAKLWVVSQI